MKNDKLYTLVEGYVRDKLSSIPKGGLETTMEEYPEESIPKKHDWTTSSQEKNTMSLNLPPSRASIQSKGAPYSGYQRQFGQSSVPSEVDIPSEINPSPSSPSKPKAPSFKPFKPVSAYQNMLKNLGYGSGVVNGKFDPQTKHAIKKFQSEHGLPTSGRPDKRTWMAMVDREMSFQDTASAANKKGLDRLNATKLAQQNSAHTGPETVDAIGDAKRIQLKENSFMEDYKLLIREELKRTKK